MRSQEQVAQVVSSRATTPQRAGCSREMRLTRALGIGKEEGLFLPWTSSPITLPAQAHQCVCTSTTAMNFRKDLNFLCC